MIRLARYTVQPAHVPTSIKQSPLLNDHLFRYTALYNLFNVISIKRIPLLNDHYSVSLRWSLKTGLTVYVEKNGTFNLSHLSIKTGYIAKERSIRIQVLILCLV